MEQKSRTYNTIRNLNYAVIQQVVYFFLNFISRTVFIKCLNQEYLGVNTVFSSILNILTLMEFGIGQIAIIWYYEPLKTYDESKLGMLYYFFQKAYRVIQAAMLIVAFGLSFCKDIFVKSEAAIPHLTLYYWLFVLNTVVYMTYGQEVCMIRANQREDILTKNGMIAQIIMVILQIILVAVTHNYLLYLVCMVGTTVYSKILCHYSFKKMFPQFKTWKRGRIGGEEKKKIVSHVKDNFLYNAGLQVFNNSTSLFVSSLINVIVAGIYSNYLLFYETIKTFMKTIYQSVYNSIGHLVTGDCDTGKKEQIFSVYQYLFQVLLLILLTGVYFISADVIQVWIGEEYLLPNITVLLLCVVIYTHMMMYPVVSFRVTAGLLKEVRWLTVASTVLMCIMAYVFGSRWGLNGILMATFIARLLTNYWWEPYLIYKKVFCAPFMHFVGKHLYYLIMYGVTFTGISLTFNNLSLEKVSPILVIIVKGVIDVIVCISIAVLMTFWMKEFQYIKQLIFQIVKKVTKKGEI